MQENDTDWEFLIARNPYRLRDLSESQGTAYFDIWGGIDHYLDCRNDDSRMTTLYAQDETDVHKWLKVRRSGLGWGRNPRSCASTVEP